MVARTVLDVDPREAVSDDEAEEHGGRVIRSDESTSMLNPQVRATLVDGWVAL